MLVAYAFCCATAGCGLAGLGLSPASEARGAGRDGIFESMWGRGWEGEREENTNEGNECQRQVVTKTAVCLLWTRPAARNDNSERKYFFSASLVNQCLISGHSIDISSIAECM